MFFKTSYDLENQSFDIDEKRKILFNRRKNGESSFHFEETNNDRKHWFYINTSILLQIFGYLKNAFNDEKNNHQFYLPYDLKEDNYWEETKEPNTQRKKKIFKSGRLILVEFGRTSGDELNRFSVQQCKTTNRGIECGVRFSINSASSIEKLLHLEKKIKTCLTDNTNFNMILKISAELLVERYIKKRLEEEKIKTEKDIRNTSHHEEKQILFLFLNSKVEKQIFKKELSKKLQEIYPSKHVRFLDGVVSIVRTREYHRQEIEKLLFGKIYLLRTTL